MQCALAPQKATIIVETFMDIPVHTINTFVQKGFCCHLCCLKEVMFSVVSEMCEE